MLVAGDPQEQLDAERRVRELLRKGQAPADVETLCVQLSHLPLRSLAPLAQCCSLRRLDASRNCIKSLEGAERLARLESLNLYSNKLADLGELLRLRPLGCLCELDLRLNPVAQQESYRLFAIKYLPRLRRLDGREVTDIERSRADRLFANLECSSSSAGSSDGGREDLWGADEGLADESSESDPPSRVLMSGSQPTRGKGPTLEHNDVEEHMLQLPQSPRRQATEIASAGGAVRRNGGLAMRTNSGIPVRISEQGRGDRNTDVHAVGRSAAHVGHETLAVAVGWSRGLESLLQESHDAALADVPCAAPRFLSDSDQAQFNNGGHALRKDHLSHGAEPANLPNRFEHHPGAHIAADAASREVRRLVEVQELRVKELQERLDAALEEARTCRMQALDAEKRAAVAEARLSATQAKLSASAHLPAQTPASAMTGPGMLTFLSSSSPDARAVEEAAVESGHAAGAARSGASREAGAVSPVAHAVDMAGVLQRQSDLIEMLRQSHAILMTDSHRLRAEVEAERAGRRKDALDYEANWKEFQALRVLVQTSPAFEKRVSGDGGSGTEFGVEEDRKIQGEGAEGNAAASPSVQGGTSTTIGSLLLSSSILSPYAPTAVGRKEGVGTGGITRTDGGGVARRRVHESEGEAYHVMGELPMHLRDQHQQHLQFMRALEMDEDDSL